ncbi:MAG: DUF4157 domain-containing protein [Sandaracinaceae bacterium]
MDPGTQGTLEGSLGRDLSTVRVHDDTRANEVAKDLNARAFTHGKDIWLARGESDRDTKLMAHETAHVLQQGGGLSRKSEGKTGAKPAGGGSDPTKKKPKKKRTFGRMKLDASKTSVGTLEKPGTVRFPKIEIPKFKRHKHRGALYDKHRPLHRTKNYQRGNPNQRTVWRESMRMTQIQQALRDKAKKARRKKDAGELSDAGPHAFSIRVAGRDLFYLGSVQSVADELVFPKWGESGGRRQFRSFHVDHVVELQLAGWEAKKGGWANTKENFELLEGRANMASGHQIKQAIIGRAWAYIKSAYVKESDAEPDPRGRREGGRRRRLQEEVPHVLRAGRGQRRLEGRTQ